MVEDEVNCKFDVVMVDLDSSDVRNGVRSPPLEFIRKDVLLAAKLVLCEFGILAINVIPPSRSFYDNLVSHFQEVFHELYKIDVGNGENFVLIATASPLVFSVEDCGNSFLDLHTAISYYVSLCFVPAFDHFLLCIQDQASDVDVLLTDADGSFHSIKVCFYCLWY